MEYSVKGRARKVNKLIFILITKLTFFKLCQPFLSRRMNEKRLSNLHPKIARHLVGTITDLEGLFVKVGQLLSTFSTILPEAYVKALELTQGHFTVRPFEEIKDRIEAELKMPIDKVFLSIEENALGSASIGQVHKGVLLSGDVVVVKVQHKNIEEIAALDLLLIRKILNFVQFIVKIPGVENAFGEVVKMINQELDYIHEAEQMKVIAANLSDDKRVLIPNVYDRYSSKRILVLEYLEGVKITNKEFVKEHNLDHTVIATDLLDMFSKTVFLDGIYHADPHPGNLLLNKEGKIILLDFGAIGRFGEQMKEGLFIIIQAIVFEDENLMISGLKEMGFVSDVPNVNKVCKKLIKLFGDYLKYEIKIEKFNFNEIDFNQIELSKVFDLVKKIDLKEIEQVFKIPKDWVLLNRSLTLLIGVTSEISPEMDAYKIVKPNLLKMLVEKDNFHLVLKTSLLNQLKRLVTLPRKIELFLEEAENGTVEISVKDRKLEVKLYYAMAQQVIFIICAGISYYFYKTFGDNVFYYVSIGGCLLFLKAFVSSFFLKRKMK